MRIPLPLALAALVTLAAGCSNESVAPDTGQNPKNWQGTIGQSDFELVLDSTGDPAHPLEGPFALRGSNVHYVDSLSALSVDLTVTNRGIVSHPEPIGLTFLKLMPDGVTVLNPDNGINGAGAAIVFAFANDDAMWTPGERSLPRTVLFGTDPGVSIGFIARLDIGAPPEGGTIAGRVWHDANEDGVADPSEEGLPGVLVVLRTIDDATMHARQDYWKALTGEDGRYEFLGLRPGVYIVAKAPTEAFRPTTPTEITVVLVMNDGKVSDFLGADFGCVPMVPPPPPPPPFQIGAWVDTKGNFQPLPAPHVVATEIHVSTCGEDTIPGPTDPPVRDCETGALRGVVTDVNRDAHVVRVMGTPLYFPEVPVDLHPGMRIAVFVARVGMMRGWTVVEWHAWNEDFDAVDGRIEDVVVGADGVLRLLVVDTWVVPAHILPMKS